ncbi:fatty acid desaturase [Tropicimonas sp. IMCC34043]|uniref:fatty acid desaturase n=1 Tax=Tropicimonas sp. IMCC34043 TaxID=2248760 RepID=UPI000E270AA4|nr:fatty acid desaturase [Tropicimonas sp. IMCC34043]
MTTSIREITRTYCNRSDRMAAISFFGTFAVYFTTLWLALTYSRTWWIVVPLIVVNGLSGVRLYVLQHDCGHASLFGSRARNDLAGYALSTFTLTPYRAMQFNHNRHHSHIGNLEAREAGEIFTMTLAEWTRASPLQRLRYRIYRNPFFLIPVGGIFVYAIRYRWPRNAARVGRAGVLLQDLFVLLWVGMIWWGFGSAGLWVYFGTVMTAGMTGVWLVYLQHNFEDTYWDRKPDLSPVQAALQGSSALDLGWLFDLATGNIAYHDIHHFNARIPSYNLRRCHRQIRDRYDLRVIRWPEALASFRLKLWDEDTGRLVPFPPSKTATLSPGPDSRARV